MTPTAKMIDSMGYKSAWAILPRISVSSVPDFSACDADLICPSGTELAAQLTVDFVDTAAADAAVAQRVQGTVSPLAPFTRQTLILSSGGVDILFDEGSPKGSGAQGVVKVSACPKNGLDFATIYYYDTPALSSVLSQTASAGYGAVTWKPVFAAGCCEPSSQLAVSGVRVIVVRQMDDQPMQLADLQILIPNPPGSVIDVATTHAKYFSFPSSGKYADGWQVGAAINDEHDYFNHTTSTWSSGDPSVAGERYDACVLNQTFILESVVVIPRELYVNGARIEGTRSFGVEYYSHLTTEGPGGIGFTGQLHTDSFVHNNLDKGYRRYLPAAADLPTSVACPNTTPRSHSTQSDLEVVSVTGEAYVRLMPGRRDDLVAVSGQVDMEASNNASTCAAGAHLEGKGSVAVCQKNPGTVLEANPDDVLPDGTPKHWAFTRNGTLKVLVRYPDDWRADIEIAGNLNDAMLDTAAYYRDSSYNKLDLAFTYPDTVTLNSTISTSTTSSVKSEALAALEDQGYHYCGGPCGTAKATDGGNLPGYDLLVIAMST